VAIGQRSSVIGETQSLPALDTINRHVFDATLHLDNVAEQRELGMRYVLIARSLERIGDNAVDIAEQAAFLISPSSRNSPTPPTHTPAHNRTSE